MRKIIASCLLVSVLALCLASCTKTPEKLVAKADKKLGKSPYKIDIDVDYTCDDEVAEIFEQLGGAKTEITVDGDNMHLENTVTINFGEGDNIFSNSYVVADGIVYMNMSYESDTEPNTVRNKAMISNEEKTSLYNKLSVAGGVLITDFCDVTAEKRDGDRVIVCKQVSEESRSKLEYVLINQLECSEELVSLRDAEMEIEIEDGRYDSITLKCVFGVTLEYGIKVYTVGMDIEMDYEYDESIIVAAPSDSGEYTDTSIDNIVW